MTTLDVLLIEESPGDGAADAARLEAAGHRVHRCWDQPVDSDGRDRIALRDRYLCTGVTRRSCPLDKGIDVALLVRASAGSHPTSTESPVTCALRAQVPLVEDGPALLDPYAPWVAGRTSDDLEIACEDAAQHALDPLRAEIAARMRRLLVTAGVDPVDVMPVIEPDGSRLVVRLEGPPLDTQVEMALCVRVLDATRAMGRPFGQVDVAYVSDRS